jgi:hypothetical protein
MREVGGDSPALRRSDPEHFLRELLLKSTFFLGCRTKCASSLPGRVTCKPGGLLAHLYAVKREHDKQVLAFLTKGTTREIVKSFGLEYELVHGPESLTPRKREALTPITVKALIRAVDGPRLQTRGCPEIVPRSWLAKNLTDSLALSGSGGFRRAEVSLVEGTDLRH